MATLTITVPNPVANRVGDAIAERHGYTGFEPDGITPQTKLEFVRKYIIKHIKREIAEHEGQGSAHAAYEAVATDVETNITLT